MTNELGHAPRTVAAVLVVDDDHRLLETLGRALASRNYAVTCAADATQALSALADQPPELVVLDVMMPGLDGLNLCRLLRERSSVPILMLTARDSVPDRVAGLQAGADDYLVKPFALDELVARIAALIRRASKVPAKQPVSYSGIVVDPATWSASSGGQQLELTRTEFRLLECLMLSREQVVTREQILRELWGAEWSKADSNVIDVHIANLRHKLAGAGAPQIVQTVRGVGFIMRAPRQNE